MPTTASSSTKDRAAILWSSDTGPTTRFWEIANRTRNLSAGAVETSFDNALQEIADVSLHLTPRTLEQELRKLERKVPILLHHLKPPVKRSGGGAGPQESRPGLPGAGQEVRF